MSILQDIINIPGCKPREEIDEYIIATGNFFPIAPLDEVLVTPEIVAHKVDEIRALLQTFDPCWVLARHAAVVTGKLVAAVVRSEEQSMFAGECFPHQAFRDHCRPAAEYLQARAKLNDKPGDAALQVAKREAELRAFSGKPSKKTLQLLLSLTETKENEIVIEGPDGERVELKVPPRGRLARDKEPENDNGKLQVKVATIERACVTTLTDGAIALFPPDLTDEQLRAAAYFEYDSGAISVRKAVWEFKGTRLLSQAQFPMRFDTASNSSAGTGREPV